MVKVLFVATVESHLLNFHLPYFKLLRENGFKVHVACAGKSWIPYCNQKFNIPFKRSPFKISNFKAYKKLKQIIKTNDYALIHCHTPVGGAIGRFAAKEARNKGAKVFYTAHGFHFYKGAPLKNWLLYFPIEKWLSRYTDCLITINEEDYKRVKDSFRAKSIKLVNGVGINLQKFIPQTIKRKKELRQKYGYDEKDFILIFAAELNYNKHQDLLINAVQMLAGEIPQIKLLLAGRGNYAEKYKKLARKLNVVENVQFLGYRDDIVNLLSLSDIAVSSSRREGLPVNIMEAMAVGLPLVVTNCRGNRDLVSDGENGYVIDDLQSFVEVIKKLYYSLELRENFRNKSLELIEAYSLENILEKMEKIYGECLI